MKKTDRDDAETLALYLSKDLLPEVRPSGVDARLSSNKALDRVPAQPLPPVLATGARVLVAQIRSLTRSIVELEALIEEEGQKLDGDQNLISIKGIGPVGATVLLSAIGSYAETSA